MDEQAADSTASEGTAGETTAKSPGTLNPPWPSFGAQASDAGLNDPDSVGAAVHGTAGEPAGAEQASQAPGGGQAGEPGSEETGERAGEQAGQPHAFGPADVVVVKASTVGQLDADRADGAGAMTRQPAGAAGQPGRAVGGHQERWRSIQAAFVDDPRHSVSEAADLVAEAVGTLVVRAKERERALRNEWDTDGADTEALRTALMRYRSFLEELPVL